MRTILILIFILISNIPLNNLMLKCKNSLTTKFAVSELNVNVVDMLNNCEWISKKPNLEKFDIIVIDFWATWCAPCIQSHPHFNRLTNKYSDESIIFISITNEKKRIVSSFLKRHELVSHIVLDTSNKIQDFFEVDHIPITHIINTKNESIWYGNPILLTDSILDRIKLKNHNNLNDNKRDLISLNEDINKITLNEITFSLKSNLLETSSSSNYINFKDNGIVCSIMNKSLCEIIHILFDLSPSRSECFLLDTIKWDFYSFNPYLNDIYDAKEIFGNMLLSCFDITMDTIEKESLTHLIFCSDSTLLNSYKVNSSDYNYTSHVSTSDSLLSSANISVVNLSKKLEEIFNVHFDSDIKNDIRYNFEIDLSRGLTGALEILDKNYGLAVNNKAIKMEITRILNNK